MGRPGISRWHSPMERFEKRVDKTGTDGCWLWIGALRGHRYAAFMVDGRTVMAHRWIYEQVHGPIPDGLQVDHQCGVTRCVNPAHLRALSPGDNCRAYYREQRTHCNNGHPLTDETTVYRNDATSPEGRRRRCRICDRARLRRYRQKH